MRPEPFKRWLRPVRLRSRLKKHVASGERLNLRLENAQWRTVQFVRESDGITIVAAKRRQFLDDRCFYYYRTFIPVLLNLFSSTSSTVRSVAGRMSDGEIEMPSTMLFSGAHGDSLLVPDPDFYNSNAYAQHRSVRTGPWKERDDVVAWRGASTGRMREGHELQRVALCRALKDVPDTDVKLYRIVEPLDPASNELADLMGGSIPEASWAARRFAIDVDGNTNAWSNLFVRLLFGCCVIKIASPFGFRQWYYERLEPWVHFVPVKADLSDLHSMIDWCRSNPAQCEEIAERGKQLARSMTIAGEVKLTADRLSAVLSA